MITGGVSGIERASAILFAMEGADSLIPNTQYRHVSGQHDHQ